jgi:NADPH:quinone reductase-like Zn-dependent oxidoreductase
MRSNVVPGSDGAGTVIAVGEKVTRFQKGDRVCTTVNQAHLSGSLTPAASQTGLGGSLDGTLRSYGVFSEDGLVPMPSSLTIREASALPCAAVTAWNVLYGLPGRAPKPGDTVLTLGSGGVSLFAIQFAVAAGATVIATTSSAAKGEKLKALGASHIIDYRKDTSWGVTARSLTPGGDGVDFVVEVGGPSTLAHSVAAIKADGVIAVAGSIGSDLTATGDPGMLSAWTSNCIVRGIAVGSRVLFEEVIRAVEAKNIKPVVDEKVFKLDQLKDAYHHMAGQRNFGKVVVEIS